MFMAVAFQRMLQNISGFYFADGVPNPSLILPVRRLVSFFLVKGLSQMISNAEFPPQDRSEEMNGNCSSHSRDRGSTTGATPGWGNYPCQGIEPTLGSKPDWKFLEALAQREGYR